LALAFSLALTTLAAQTDQSSSVQPSPPLNLLNPNGTLNWSALDQASQQIYQQALEQAQTQSDLSSLLEDSHKQYTNLLFLTKTADKAKDKVVQSALFKSDSWRDIAIVVVAAFGGYVADGWTGAGIGAAAGFALDGGLEIFKIRL
jgi:hypothetical protein